jgi:hypothetical protein
MISLKNLFYGVLSLCVAATSDRLRAGLSVLGIDQTVYGLDVSKILSPIFSFVVLGPLFAKGIIPRFISAFVVSCHYFITEGTSHATHERFLWLALAWGFVWFSDKQFGLVEIAKRTLVLSYTVSGVWKLIALFSQINYSLPFWGIEKVLPEHIALHHLRGYDSNIHLIPALQGYPMISAILWIWIIAFELFVGPLYWRFLPSKRIGLVAVFLTLHLGAQFFLGIFYFWQMLLIVILFCKIEENDETMSA